MDENIQEKTENMIEAEEYQKMGQNLLGAEKPSEAIAMLDKSLKIDPMNKEAYILKGICCAELEKYDEAKLNFKNALKIDKAFGDAYFQLGNIAFLENDDSQGMKYYNEAVSYGYDRPEVYFNLGLVYEEQDKYDEALRNYSRAIKQDEMNAGYWIRKISLQIYIAKYEEALQNLEKFRVLFPDSYEGYHLTAAVYTMQAKYDEADTVLKRALDMFPDDKDLLFDRMRLLVTKGDTEGALELLETAKSMGCTDEEQKEILLNEGKIYAQKEQLDKSEECFVKALKTGTAGESDSEIRYFLMNVYLVNKEFEKLKSTAQQADRKAVNDPYSLCAVYFECVAEKGLGSAGFEKKYMDAVRYFRNISLNDPSRIDAYLFRAMCYKDIKNYEKALESVDYVLTLDPENAQMHQIKGNILSEMEGRSAEATEEYRVAKQAGFQMPGTGGGILG